jgi:hypothetical protein
MNVWFDDKGSYPLTGNTRDLDNHTYNGNCTDNPGKMNSPDMKASTVRTDSTGQGRIASYMDSIEYCRGSDKGGSCMCKGIVNYSSRVDWT